MLCICWVKVWLQEFAWTESEKEDRLHMRCSSNDQCSSEDKSSLHSEPMFCLETAINMLYWSASVYDHEEVRPSVTVCIWPLPVMQAFKNSKSCHEIELATVSPCSACSCDLLSYMVMRMINHV